MKITGGSDTVLVINVIGGKKTTLIMEGKFELFGGLTADHLLFNFMDVARVDLKTDITASLFGVNTTLDIIGKDRGKTILVDGNIVFDNINLGCVDDPGQ